MSANRYPQNSLSPDLEILSACRRYSAFVFKDDTGKLKSESMGGPSYLSERELAKLIWQLARDGLLKPTRIKGKGSQGRPRTYTRYLLTPKGHQLLKSLET